MRIEKLDFKVGATSDSPPLSLSPGRMTLFIGPNNGGKSRALFEIQDSFIPAGHNENMIFNTVSFGAISDEEFNSKLAFLTKPKRPGDDKSSDTVAFEGKGGRVIANLQVVKSGLSRNAPPNIRQYAASHFFKYFYVNLSGTERLALVNPVQAEPFGLTPATTISSIYQDDKLRKKLSLIVHKAFTQFLVIDPTQMPNLVYRLSASEPKGGIEKRLDKKAVDYFRGAMPLHTASDGTKAFVGILCEVLAGDPDIIFIDEPEAFLHPSLAYLLGQQISSDSQQTKQVFAATHSPAFLLGCTLSGAPVDIIRLTFRAGVATARHLGASQIKKLMTDPMFRSVGAATALFYENAVIVEGDSDRAFYDEINERMIRFRRDGLGHTIFLNAHNKQTIVNIVKPLRSIGIPAAFIMDIDWIKEDGQVWDRYFSAIGAPVGLKESMWAARRFVRNALEKVEPNYKRKGGICILSDAERAAANAFFDQMETYGLFTVRGGELETWLADLDLERSKSKWLQSVFELMGGDPEKKGYIRPGTGDVWDFISRIKKWTSDPNRAGMNYDDMSDGS